MGTHLRLVFLKAFHRANADMLYLVLPRYSPYRYIFPMDWKFWLQESEGQLPFRPGYLTI